MENEVGEKESESDDAVYGIANFKSLQIFYNI